MTVNMVKEKIERKGTKTRNNYSKRMKQEGNIFYKKGCCSLNPSD